MASHDDVRRLALALEGVSEDGDSFSFRVDGRLLAWLWPERVDPKRRRVPNPDVIVLPVRDEMDKQTLVALEPESIFTEPHYDGWADILVRLPKVDLGLLERLIGDAWALQTSKPPPRPRKGKAG